MKSEPSPNTPPNDELLKALRAPNSPYKKVGVLREFHNAAAEVIAQLQEQARIWEQRCHEEEKNAAQHYADLMALRTRSETKRIESPTLCEMATPITDAHLAHLNLPDGRKVGIPNETVALLRQLERDYNCISATGVQSATERCSEEMADSVRGVLQIIRNKQGATFKDVRRHCEARGDEIVGWPEWVLNAEGYVTEQGAAMMLFEIMAGATKNAADRGAER